MWVALITRSRIISNRQYIPCSLYQTCLVRDTALLMLVATLTTMVVGWTINVGGDGSCIIDAGMEVAHINNIGGWLHPLL